MVLIGVKDMVAKVIERAARDSEGSHVFIYIDIYTYMHVYIYIYILICVCIYICCEDTIHSYIYIKINHYFELIEYNSEIL
jgi:hypothetical protein